MKIMSRKCIIGQSGGPTVVINATLAGVIQGALKADYEKIYGMINGIDGLLDVEIRLMLTPKQAIVAHFV